jgi:hypothetical protein
LYHFLFRGRRRLREAIEAARGQFSSEPARRMLEFVHATKRGICRDTGSRKEDAEE